MYNLVRLMLVATLGLMLFSLVVIALAMGTWGWVCLAVVMAFLFRKEAKQLTAFGTAAWAKDLPKGNGLIVGRATGRPTGAEKIRTVLDKRVDAKTACERFFSRGKDLVRLNAVHTLVCAPTGVGKGVSCIAPFLLTSRESCVVADVKDGENARITARARAKMGHRVVLLDPWRRVTQKPDTLNPLDFIDKSPRAIDDCYSLANALVIRTGAEKDPHFSDRSEDEIAGAAATTVWYGQKDNGTRSIQKVAELLSNPEARKAAIQLMRESGNVWNGALARIGGQLSHSVGDELASILSTVNRFIRFLNSPVIVESTERSSFDATALRKGKMSVFLILPAEYMDSHAGLMRMWLVTLMGAVMRGGLQ